MAVCTKMNAIVGFVLVCKLLVSDAQLSCTNATTWDGVPEDEYDISYDSIEDPVGRPYGFSRDTIPYDPTRPSNPCVSISSDLEGNGISGRRIEVMAESNPPGNSVCVSRGMGDAAENTCEDSRIYLCEQITGDTANYVFHCTGQSCNDQPVPFFYRFTVSPSPQEMDPELWCMNRETTQYPSTLAPLPPGFTQPPAPMTTKDTAAVTYHSAVLVALGCILSLLARLF